MATQFAICTLLTNDGYLPGALAQVAALRDLHPRPSSNSEVDFTTLCLVTPETVDVSSIKLLRKAYDVVVGVEIIEPEDDKGLHLLGRLDLNQVLTKLHVFRLTQYSKVIFLDADVLPIRPLSHLLTLPHNFSAVPDVGWPDIFNSGVMVLTPSEASFDELMELQRTTPSWDGGDQGLLNEWRGGDWNRLSFTYNTTPTAAYTYAPAYERFGSKISAIHFIGPNKPWKQIPYRAPGSETFRQEIENGQTAYDYSSLVDRWFATYDRHYRVTAVPAGGVPRFEVPRYQATWDEGTSLGAEVLPSAFTPAGPVNYTRSFPASDGPGSTLGLYPGPPGSSAAVRPQFGGGLGLDDLRKMAVEGMNSVSGPFFVDGGLGEYRSMPLGGRFDLMRPKRIPKPLTQEQEQPTPQAEGQGEQGHSHGGDDGHHPPPGGGPPPPPGGGHGTSHGSSGSGGYQPPSGHSGHEPSGDQGGNGHHGDGGQGPYQQHGGNHYPQSSDSEWYPTTGHLLHVSGGSPPRMDTLPTPDPRELPPAPRPHFRHLPATHGQGEHHRQASPHPNHPSFQTFLEQHSPSSRHHRNHGSLPSSGPHHEHRAHGHHHGHHHHAGDSHHGTHSQHHDHHLPQERPQSPPMLVWNPALDPPPNHPPRPSAFPEVTYFENAWDRQQEEHSPKGGSPTGSRQPSDEPFFHPSAPSQIPETLIQQGHYQNVIGPVPEDHPGHHAQPVPDRAKVKPTFPWEEQPRHIPNRVFPKTDSPPPTAVFIEQRKPPTPPPIVPPPPLSAPPFSRRSSQALMTPPGVFPPTIAYANAWDVVPAIQKYASKLVRPEDRPLMPRPPVPVIDDREYVQNREWEQEAEIGSQDADDEDEDDDDEGSRSRRSRDDDVDLVQEGVQTPRIDHPPVPNGGRRVSGGRSRAGTGTGTASPTQSFLVSRKKKEYRDFAVQTDLVETRPKGVQVSFAVQVSPNFPRKQGSRTQSASSGVGIARPNLGELRRESFSRTPARTGLGFGPVGEEPWRGRVESLPSRRLAIPSFAEVSTSPLAPPALIRTDSWRSDRRMSNPVQPMTAQFPTTAISGGSPGQGAMSPRMASPPKVSPPIRVPKLSNASTTSAATASEVLTPTSVRGGPGPLGRGRPKLPGLGMVERTVSGASADTAILSPPESLAPPTPYDTFSQARTTRKGGRVWNPNTGVDVIKRGSEEVLARFLRQSSWEDEEAAAEQ